MTSNHTLKWTQNVLVIKHIRTLRLITQRLCYTAKTVIKRLTARYVSVRKRQKVTKKYVTK
jgi:hypothetical protein